MPGKSMILFNVEKAEWIWTQISCVIMRFTVGLRFYLPLFPFAPKVSQQSWLFCMHSCSRVSAEHRSAGSVAPFQNRLHKPLCCNLLNTGAWHCLCVTQELPWEILWQLCSAGHFWTLAGEFLFWALSRPILKKSSNTMQTGGFNFTISICQEAQTTLEGGEHLCAVHQYYPGSPHHHSSLVLFFVQSNSSNFTILSQKLRFF